MRLMIGKLSERDRAKFGQIKYGLNVTVCRLEAIAPGQLTRLTEPLDWYEKAHYARH